jgi:hypothetical protein
VTELDSVATAITGVIASVIAATTVGNHGIQIREGPNYGCCRIGAL